nr:cullin-1 isoform X1 [Tanacetum cinerariifolium]
MDLRRFLSRLYAEKECLKREKDRVRHYLHSSSDTTLLFTISLASLTLGTVLIAFLKKRDGEEINEELLLIVSLIAYSGIQQAFFWLSLQSITSNLGESGVSGVIGCVWSF